MAVLFAFTLIPAIGLAGGAVDTNRWSHAGAALQNAADAAALTAASLRDEREADRIARAEALAEQNWKRVQSRYGAIEYMSVEFDGDNVTLTATATVQNVFLPLVGLNQTTLTRTSVAGPAGGPNPCVISLGETGTEGKGPFLVKSNASVNLPYCSIYSNSTADNALYSESNASVSASHLCAVGDAVDYGNPGFDPDPETNCEPAADPFAAIPAPTWSGCDHDDRSNTTSGATALPMSIPASTAARSCILGDPVRPTRSRPFIPGNTSSMAACCASIRT